MAYKVIQWATGQLGRAAVTGITGHPALELVGCWAHSPEKDGRDVGTICGLPPLGVAASNDKEALLASDADCVCYMAARTWTQSTQSIVDELARILRSGKNVVNATWPALIHPAGVSQEVHDELQAACLEGGSSLYTGGIDPGHGSFGLAMSALSVSSSVSSIHTYEIGNYADYDNPDITRLLGFGQPDETACPLFRPGTTSSMFASSLHLLASAMGTMLDNIVEGHEALFADEAFEIAAGPIGKGTIAGMRFWVQGMKNGHPLATIEHVTKLRDGDFPKIDFAGHGYRVEVKGEPNMRLDLQMTSDNGDEAHATFVACAMAVVNAIPQVCDAPPGIVTYLDLVPHPSRNLPGI